MPSAKLRTSGQGLASARDNQSTSVPDDRLRIRAVNSSARSRAIVRSGLAARSLSRRTPASAVPLSGRRIQSNEAPRPEAEVSGRPPRGGRSRQLAPFGGRQGSRPDRRHHAPAPRWHRDHLHDSRTLSHQEREPNTEEGTPDRWKLFGSHGQRPWFHEVMSRPGRGSDRKPARRDVKDCPAMVGFST